MTHTIKRSFFVRAIDSTRYWESLPPYATKAFSLYVICDGEATHLASLTPSSYAMGLPNAFTCPSAQYEALISELDKDSSWEYEGIENNYIDFKTHDKSEPNTVSELIEFECESDEPIDESEPLPDWIHDDLWDQAFEYFSGNSHEPKCCNFIE